jgi:uncharacterized heparinase superfamily protein
MARLPDPDPLLQRLAAWGKSVKLAGLGGRRAERAGLYAAAAKKLLQDQFRAEWAGSPPHRWLISRPAPQGLAAAPREGRPPRERRGKAMLAGRFVFDGLALEAGPGGDPWNRAAPSRAFAAELHGMDWLADLLPAEGGAKAALGLVLGWHAVFGRWNSFSWSAPVLERRVHNLACAMGALTAQATAAEAALLLDSLARQARHLMLGDGHATRAAEQAAAAATGAVVLGGPAGERLLERALKRLEQALPLTVLPDGGHASRSPEAGMELLLDLKTLDDGLLQRGRAAPAELPRAIDRLGAALRFFTLADGRLAALQGSEDGDPARIAAALGGDGSTQAPSPSAPHAGYERLTGVQLQAMVDAGAPAPGAWSASACAQPLALEVVAGQDRLIASSAWSLRAPGAQALRLTPAASTASVSDASCGYPLQGWLAKVLGHRLEGAVAQVRSRRHDSEAASWLELSHDGWAQAFGLVHDRRLYLDRKADELRGEDEISPIPDAVAPRRRRPVFLTVRFQLHPDVKASLALDHRSVLLQPRGHDKGGAGGWWLRNDAPEVSLEPAVRLTEGRPHHTAQVVLRALLKRDGSARIRWKLSPATDKPASLAAPLAPKAPP